MGARDVHLPAEHPGWPATNAARAGAMHSRDLAFGLSASISLCQGQQGSNSRSALSAELMNEGASFSLPIGITDAVLGMHGGAADVVRRTS